MEFFQSLLASMIATLIGAWWIFHKGYWASRRSDSVLSLFIVFFTILPSAWFFFIKETDLIIGDLFSLYSLFFGIGIISWSTYTDSKLKVGVQIGFLLVQILLIILIFRESIVHPCGLTICG